MNIMIIILFLMIMLMCEAGDKVYTSGTKITSPNGKWMVKIMIVYQDNYFNDYETYWLASVYQGTNIIQSRIKISEDDLGTNTNGIVDLNLNYQRLMMWVDDEYLTIKTDMISIGIADDGKIWMSDNSGKTTGDALRNEVINDCSIKITKINNKPEPVKQGCYPIESQSDTTTIGVLDEKIESNKVYESMRSKTSSGGKFMVGGSYKFKFMGGGADIKTEFDKTWSSEEEKSSGSEIMSQIRKQSSQTVMIKKGELANVCDVELSYCFDYSSTCTTHFLDYEIGANTFSDQECKMVRYRTIEINPAMSFRSSSSPIKQIQKLSDLKFKKLTKRDMRRLRLKPFGSMIIDYMVSLPKYILKFKKWVLGH